MLETISNDENYEKLISTLDKKCGDTKEIKEKIHKLRIMLNEITKQCKAAGVPFFFSYYIPGEEYKYNALFPEEICDKDAPMAEDSTQDNPKHKDIETPIKSEYWRFVEFLKIVIGFNREDYKPVIRKNSERKTPVEEDDFL